MPSRFQEMLKTQRENAETSRAGLKWDVDEDSRMISMIRDDNSSIEDVAKVLRRTPGSIRTRLIITAVNKMNDDGMSLADAAKHFGIDENDISEYLNRKMLRDSKKQNRVQKHKDASSSDIIRRIEQLEKAVFNK